METGNLTEQQIDDLVDTINFHHKAETDPFACPFREGSWSHRFWMEGYQSGMYASNPYDQNSFSWEAWLSGHRCAWWTPLDKNFP